MRIFKSSKVGWVHMTDGGERTDVAKIDCRTGVEPPNFEDL